MKMHKQISEQPSDYDQPKLVLYENQANRGNSAVQTPMTQEGAETRPGSMPFGENSSPNFQFKHKAEIGKEVFDAFS